MFAPNGAMCKFSPNDPVWTGAICACGPLECKAGIHPCATRPDGAAIRRALQKGGIEHHDLQGSDIDAWHDRDKCRICAALADLDVLLRDRDEARQALAEANQTVVLLQHARRKDVHKMFDDVAKIVGYHGKSWDELLVELAALLTATKGDPMTDGTSERTNDQQLVLEYSDGEYQWSKPEGALQAGPFATRGEANLWRQGYDYAAGVTR